MICNSYYQLSHYEKVEFMGKLCHASQSDDVLFQMAQELIRLGEQRGLFDKVSFDSPFDRVQFLIPGKNKQPEDRSQFLIPDKDKPEDS